MQLVLASNSPRRKDILKEFGFSFSVMPSEYQEIKTDLSPIDLAVNFAYGKANDVLKRLINKQETVVLGADTIVLVDEEILGKPKSREDAFNMLSRLSGREHYVITGYAILAEGISIKGYDSTKVVFNSLSKEYIYEYLDCKKPFDKAGSYGIQDGFDLCKEYIGSYYNIVGLPIEKIKEEIEKHKIVID